MIKSVQTKIEERIKEKDARQDKTSLSILISWALNAALNTLSEEERGGKSEEEKGKDNWQRLVEERHHWFIDKYREFMLENMPIEPNGALASKLTQEQIEKQSEGQRWQKRYDELSEIDAMNGELQKVSELNE